MKSAIQKFVSVHQGGKLENTVEGKHQRTLFKSKQKKAKETVLRYFLNLNWLLVSLGLNLVKSSHSMQKIQLI